MQLCPDWSRPLTHRIVIRTVATLSTLADMRAPIEHLPNDHRDDPTWRHVAAQLEQVAAGVEVVDFGIALRLALMLEGLEYQGRNEAAQSFGRAIDARPPRSSALVGR
jgi:hypothetical protein